MPQVYVSDELLLRYAGEHGHDNAKQAMQNVLEENAPGGGSDD